MAYQFNPHRHVKIWISKNPDSFLNFENQKRLIKMRALNPTDEISFVYADNLLNDKAKQELAEFCKKHNITPVSIEKNIIPECQSEKELALAECYQHEIANLQSGGGNPASASDILRWMGPVYRRGVYADFDVEVKTQGLPEQVSVDAPFLFNLGSVTILTSRINLLSFNNDCIAIVNEQAALKQIEQIQDGILSAYNGAPNPFSYTANPDKSLEELTPILPGFLISFIERVVDTFTKAAKELNLMQEEHQTEQWQTPANIRQQLKDEKENNPFVYAQRAVRALGFDASSLTPENYVSEVAEKYRQAINHKTGWLGWITLPQAQYQYLRNRLELTDEQLYEIVVKETYRNMYMQTVLNSTGPTLLMLALFGQTIFDYQQIQQDLARYAFSQYEMDKYFDLENGLKIGSSVIEGLSKLYAIESPGEIGDLSWVDSGAKNQKSREEAIKERIEASVKTLPSDFSQLAADVRQHIAKIESQLAGCFGFYRNNARHIKLDALQGLLSHISGEHFDVHGFYAALNSYRHAEGIGAAFGKSETVALIDRCEKLCNEAIFCDLDQVRLKDEPESAELEPSLV